MIRVGLNPYGLSYTVLGWPGGGTARANPKAIGLSGYLDLAEELGARALELPDTMLEPLGDAGLEKLKARLDARGILPVLSQSPPVSAIARSIKLAEKLGARTIRLALTPVLCGARAELGGQWPEIVADVKRMLCEAAPRAAAKGMTLAVENHQDFTSAELMDFCELGGPNVGVTLDTGNPLAVGEDPVAFTRTVAPRVRHVHLKDYRAHWDAEGYRLVRCPTGDGAIPFLELAQVLNEQHAEWTAVLEPGALSARHVKLLTRAWWQGYAPRRAEDLAAGLAAARVNRMREDEDWRTPWEQGSGAEAIVAYELEQIKKSAENVRAWGW
ncbi:MAG: sugar phosphate isomerase/epimerase [Planctomycetes bacterium]|nr:sugar phosphate isomerase/epimerase [Planctomycetota bacterium]